VHEDRPSSGLVSSASLTLGTRIVAFVFSGATNVILARSLGPEGRGVYAVAVMATAIISLLAQLGVGPANVYHLSKKLIDLDELIGHSTSLALLLGTLCFGIVFGLVAATGSTSVLGVGSRYIVVASAAVPFMLLTAFMQSLLQGGQRFVHFNAVLLIQYGAPTICLVLALFVFRDRTLGAVTAWTASSAVTALAAAYTVAPLSRFSLRMRIPTLRALLRFGSISYLGNVTSYVNYRFDVLIVNLFTGARQVGLYSVGTALAEIVWFITNAAALVLAPRVASARLEEADRITEAVARMVGLLTLLAAVGLAVTAPFLVVLFFGSAFAESTWAVWLLLPGIVTFSISRILSMYLLGRNKLKIDLLAAAVGLVITLTLDLLLIPRYGFRGAAVASSIAYTSAMLVNLTWVVRHSTITPASLLVARPQDVRMLWTRLRHSGITGSLAR
jgi:O-antigen/teichoic acid export membrane protein